MDTAFSSVMATLDRWSAELAPGEFVQLVECLIAELEERMVLAVIATRANEHMPTGE